MNGFPCPWTTGIGQQPWAATGTAAMLPHWPTDGQNPKDGAPTVNVERFCAGQIYGIRPRESVVIENIVNVSS